MLTLSHKLLDHVGADVKFKIPVEGLGFIWILRLDGKSSPRRRQLLHAYHSPTSSIIGLDITSCRKLTLCEFPSNQNGTFKDQVQLLRGQSEEIRGLTHPIRRVYRDIDELKPEHTPGSVVLYLDGGGIKSYSSLLILKALMEEVCSIQGSKTLRPRDYFDYVFGSSSGG